jgi:hypothetical protein
MEVNWIKHSLISLATHVFVDQNVNFSPVLFWGENPPENNAGTLKSFS